MIHPDEPVDLDDDGATTVAGSYSGGSSDTVDLGHSVQWPRETYRATESSIGLEIWIFYASELQRS